MLLGCCKLQELADVLHGFAFFLSPASIYQTQQDTTTPTRETLWMLDARSFGRQRLYETQT
jgi:hypothetical protein